MAETSFLHEELMQEEGLSIRDIPIELHGWHEKAAKAVGHLFEEDEGEGADA